MTFGTDEKTVLKHGGTSRNMLNDVMNFRLVKVNQSPAFRVLTFTSVAVPDDFLLNGTEKPLFVAQLDLHFAVHLIKEEGVPWANNNRSVRT